MAIDELDMKPRELRAGGSRGTVLALAGALASDVFFEDVAAQPSLDGVRLVAATLPGYAGTPATEDDSVEAFAAQAYDAAAELGAGVVAGHSLGANVAIEMAGSGRFRGSLVLISPSFSRRDESIVPRVLDRLSTVFGNWPYTLVLKLIGRMLEGEVPADRLPALAAELQRNDPRFVRHHTRIYLRYLDRHGSLVGTLLRLRAPDAGRVRRERRRQAPGRGAPCARGVPAGDARHGARYRPFLAQHPSGPDRRAPRRGDHCSRVRWGAW